jgi:alkanesulfonate monooxygenase SsuD/methylene tetrahydromethanopterin reductase-like flavin-dependent oxidoreductase (luciferase family)
MDEVWTAGEKAALQQQLGASIIGSPATVKEKLEKFQEDTQADEIMIISQIYDHEARVRSYEIVAGLMNN